MCVYMYKYMYNDLYKYVTKVKTLKIFPSMIALDTMSNSTEANVFF